ncbi:HlyD family secretion protein [Paraburkholderia solisilvae]|uniref:Colicin V secretion protein CvaA n=1 Tax=Paraburkholderia solisilvae TaxID=624376 RepID=A0A6J5DK27_9BURK|nr:HlyD family efflux transporter periplasmic adaptor subunit [Paraburkholderia solisilvae]CAB3753572.1 Colicin V secretion protein CvaA [Paraburkholderia solisilvae]
MNLFRHEVLDAKATKWMGNIVLVRPVSFRLYTAIAAVAACAVIAFLYFGTYTRRTTVNGQLLPDAGLIKIYAPQPGIVVEKHVKEGELVTRGQLIYVLSSDRQSAPGLSAQSEISAQVRSRVVALEEERQKTEALQQGERNTAYTKVTSLTGQLRELDAQIASQTERTDLARDALTRYEALASQDYISKDQVQQKRADLIDQQMKQQNLERDRAGTLQALTESKNDSSGLALKQMNQLSELERTLSSTREELAESEVKRQILITAPQAGIATGVLAEVGQAVNSSRPLLSIVPAGARLDAQLYASSGAIGFIRAGNPVLLRYQAYPYQKFGEYGGRVAAVAHTALPSSDLLAPSAPASGPDSAYYLITVRLDRQAVHAYGSDVPLQSGMTLEADIFQERRRLYEWALAPLYSLTGKLGI